MILSKETMESLIQKTHFPLKNKYRDASWSARYKDLYLKLYGEDAGLEQCQHKIQEELDYTLNGGIDGELIQTLEQDKHLY